MSFISSFPKADSAGIKLSGIAVTTPPNKTSYYAGDTFDITGMVVTAIYTNGATSEVTGYLVTPSPLTIDTSFVTITYSENASTVYALQDVDVSKLPITIPTITSSSFTYDGNSKSPTFDNYDSSKINISGIDSAINAGSYNVVFSLIDNNKYQWSDGTITDKTVSWSIAKAIGSLSIDPTSVTLDTNNLSKTITVTRLGDGIISAVSNNTSVATVSISGNTITISSVNNTTGSATITVSVAEGTNYTSPPNATCSVTATFIPTLNQASWDYIKSNSSTGSSYWSVGDCKAVTLNGTVGAYTFSSETYYCYILGFNHNSTYEGNGIHFAFGKTALTGGTNICFVDSSYGSTTSSASFHINSSNTNTGGWNSSYARQTLCNSQFKSALPSDLQSVLKQQTKYTDNTGGGSNTASYVASTLDYIFLLAEYEVFGERTYANSAEQNYQKQYQYYINGNSKVKYKNSIGTTAYWWLRSPYYGYSDYFCYVSTIGGTSYDDAYNSRGFAPGFVI